MKSLSWAVLGLLMAVPSFAADNNIKMVTYFPVPYAAYGDLGVTGTCDVGLMGQCKLDAGKNLTVAKGASDSRALNTGSIIVRKGTLGLTPASSVAAGTSITAGSAIGTGILEFSHDLAVTSINSSRLATARAMNEAQMNSLNMYGNVFPKCDESGNKISWKKLTMGNKSGVFLVCGGNNTCSGKGTESCGCENKGTRSRVCDTSTGRWSAWSECSIEDCSCDDRTYKLAHKSECCPSQPTSDTDCWKWKWSFDCEEIGQCYVTQPDPAPYNPEKEVGECNSSREGMKTPTDNFMWGGLHYCNGVEEVCYYYCRSSKNGW